MGAVLEEIMSRLLHLDDLYDAVAKAADNLGTDADLHNAIIRAANKLDDNVIDAQFEEIHTDGGV